MLVGYAALRDAKLLKDYYFHLDQPLPAAGLAVREGYRAEEWAQRLEGLRIALGFYQANEASRDGAAQQCAVLAKATAEQMRLMQVQRQLEQETQGVAPPLIMAPLPGMAPPPAKGTWRFIDQPLNETLYRCFCYGQTANAERLRNDFKVPDRRWWRLKVKGLAHSHMWPALWEFSCSKKPPGGLEPFMEACMAQGACNEAARYAQRMPPAEAVPAWLRLGETDMARRVAIQHKEKQPDLLSTVSAHEQKP